MRTNRTTAARKGDVIDVRSGVSGNSYGQILITDERSAGRYGCVEGGHECRPATPQEVAQAKAEGRHSIHYD